MKYLAPSMTTRVRATGSRATGARPFFLRTEMDVLLLLSMLFSCLLVIARMIHTGNLTFCGLLWNTILAYIPYFITDSLARRSTWVSSKPLFAFFFVLWLLFVPNSFYIITDLFHLADRRNDHHAPMWLDLAMIFSCAWNGLLLGVLSVRQMEKILLPDSSHSKEGALLPALSLRRGRLLLPGLPLRRELLFLFPIMWLNALGVYIGRYLRYNSWDVVSDPFQLFSDIVRMIVHPLRYQYGWGMIFCFSILMTLMYLLLKRVSKSLNS
jgi:uncharacterized membrane protein